ncbi:glycosyltransferase family 4 protein [Sphingomonas sp. PvP055]|uniref:glycosyltransferase family 4 protein n=1 Tax=Sphingomonas sp. PvP055 TaxID=3156391 RepID=UPI003396385F
MVVNLPDPEQVSSPLQVGLLTWALPPEKSGLSRAALEIAHAVAEAGANVRVFTLDRHGRTRDGALDIIGCAPRGGLATLRRLAAFGHLAAPLAFRGAVMAEHRLRPFDVIEATNWYAPGAGIAATRRMPLVTRNSTPAAISLAQDPTLRNRFDRAGATLIERLSARWSGGLISNTAAHGDTIADLYDVPPPGPRHAVIGLSLPQAITERGRRATYPTSQNPVELLFVGRNEPRKGFDALCGAVALLAADTAAGCLPAFRLTLVGAQAEDVAMLPAQAQSFLRLFHRVDETALHDLFEAAHVVVAPSRYESFGLVYQEAMMFGRPVVACAEDASARLFVGESGAGALAARCSAEAVAAALRPLIADSAVRARYAAASRAASGQFTRRTLGEQTIAAYRSAIGSNGRSNRASSSARAPSADMAA